MHSMDSVLSAASLAMDAFAVAICTGACGAAVPARTAALRMGVAFGAFQFIMPYIGFLLGAYAINMIASFDHWVAFGLLAFVGVNMIRESFEIRTTSDNPKLQRESDSTRPATLLYLAVATSIDALAVGAGFALDSRPVGILAASAGIITAVLAYLGVVFGKRIGCEAGSKVEFAGGTVLILIGANILRTHIF